MAFDPNEKDPNQQQENLNQPITSSAPGSGPGSAVGKGSAPQATPSQPFQNLSAYLSANAPQVQEQAGKISDNLNNQYGQIQNDINKGKSDFGQQVTSGYASPNKDLVERAAKNPSQFASDPNNVKAFQSLYNDKYTGPDAFETSDTYGSLNQNVNKAVSDASQMTSVPGLETYFQKNNPNATRGGNLLDSVLLQGNQDAYGNVIKAAKQYSGLPDYLSGAVTEANKGVSNAQKTAQDTANQVQSQFTGENGIIPTLKNNINTEVTNARQSAQDTTAKTVDDFLSGRATNEELNALKIGNPQFYNDLMSTKDSLGNDYKQSFDLKNYFTPQSADVAINSGNVASNEEYQNAAALASLTGMDLSDILNPSNSSQAGTAPKILNDFNLMGASNDIHTALRQQDQSYIQQNPQPSDDPTKKNFQMNLVSRNPQLLQDSNWAMWYQGNGGNTGSVVDPNLTPQPGGGGVAGPGSGFIDPTTGRKVV